MQHKASIIDDSKGSISIEVLKAAAGKSKTGTRMEKAKQQLQQTRTIFSVRSIKTGASIQKRLTEQFKVSAEYIRRIDSETCFPGTVLLELDGAIQDSNARIIICTQEALVRYEKWYEYGPEFVLNIDELPSAVIFSSCAFTYDAAKSIVDMYGLKSTDAEDTDTEQLIDAINSNPIIFQNCAEKMLEDENSNAEYKTWDGSVIDVLNNAKDTNPRYIHASSIKRRDATKILITTAKKSGLFDVLQYFKEITLTTMLLEGHEFQVIGKAEGISFFDYDWEHQNKPFDHSANVTLVVMTDLDGIASKNQFIKLDSNGDSLFVRAINKLVTLDCFKPENAIESSKKKQIMLYTNERYQVQLKSLNLEDRFELLPYNTHGLPTWECENLFASFLTYQWIPTFNTVGKCLAEDLGIEFDKLVDAYNFTHMFEPICQSMTRGVVRTHDKGKDVRSWIAVPDLWTAQELKRLLFPDAAIDTNYMVSVQDNVQSDNPVGRPPTWRATAMEHICIQDRDAQWINRNIDKIGQHFGKDMDNTNPIDVCLAIHYLERFQPKRTPYKTDLLSQY